MQLQTFCSEVIGLLRDRKAAGHIGDLRRFLRTAALLARPGSVHEADERTDAHPDLAPEELAHMSQDELQLLLEEARRHLDRADMQLEGIRGRAQVLFGIALLQIGATTALVGAMRSSATRWAWLVWAVGLTASALGAGAAGAIHSVPVRLEQIHPVVAARYKTELLPTLTRDMANIAITSNRTTSSLVNVYRQAVLCTVLGSALAIIPWAWVRLSA